MTKSTVLDDWFAKIDSDISYLSDCFAEVLFELGEGPLAAALPWGNSTENSDATSENTADAINREMQMWSIVYHLLNLVEENASAQARRAREERFGLLHEPGLWGHGIAQLMELGTSADKLAAALASVQVEIVLTAHPTEAKRPAVLRQHRELFEEFTQLENSVWTTHERELIRNRIKSILERLWRTGEMYLEKPDVLTELEYVMDYLREVFPPAVASVQHRLRQAWIESGQSPDRFPPPSAWPSITFGNWVGGDRDGHPYVTAEVTRKTLAILRSGALDILNRSLQGLSQRLTLSDLFQSPPVELTEAITRFRSTTPSASNASRPDFPGEPWREYVEHVRARCRPDAPEGVTAYNNPEELAKDIMLLRRSLEFVGAKRIAESEIDPITIQLNTFGFHLAALDIRQNSAFYEKALSQLMQIAGLEDWDYASWNFEKRRAFLEMELSSPRPFAQRHADVEEEAQAVLDCFQTVANHIKKFGSDGIGSFVVSMTRDVTDLLMVYIFAREVGLLRAGENGMYSAIKVVPLFETIDDLTHSADILQQYFQVPIVERSLRREHDGTAVQQVMVGYSDSGKDAGIFTSQWGLHCAQSALVDLGAKFGVRIEFFHGRGGTLSRGAGPTHRFLEALPSGSLGGAVRVTEQGEVIAQKFGNTPTAVFNLELLLAGVAVTSEKHRNPQNEDPVLSELCHKLSEVSGATYRKLLRSDDFLEFWSQATPIDALERSFIGSRPSRRTGKTSIEDLRAIPWVFSWTQARYYLPSWYGVGTALQWFQDNEPDRFKILQENVDTFPFLKYVIYNVETSLASADLEMMRTYSTMVEDDAVRESQFNQISEEYQRTERMIDALFGERRDTRRPRLVKTLDMRAEGLRRLHARQIELLTKWRSLQSKGEDVKAEAMLPSLLLSINAIASAERTTG